jgi:DNA repair exonuclease SbcCD nuclease subunit
MRARFIHLADVHLGYEQYGSRERFDDFAKAFLDIIDSAIQRQADFVVIAGDLFNKRAIDAQTLSQAHEALDHLKHANIPAIAIEGNHDRSYYRDGMSWLQYLSWQQRLILLNPVVRDGMPALVPWNPKTQRGAYVDLMDGRLRVYGLPWYGASTAKIVENFASVLSRARELEEQDGIEYRLLLMHTCVEGIVPQLHGLPTRAQLEPLHGLVDYLALGHVHKPYELDGWLYNPGSTETWSAEESAWERGYYVVDVETAGAASGGQDGALPLKHTARHLTNQRRPFYRFQFSVEEAGDPAALEDLFTRFCQEHARKLPTTKQLPVVEVSLQGVLPFDATALDQKRLEGILQEHFRPLIGRLHNLTHEIGFVGEDDGGDGRDRSTWYLLERKIFQEMLARDARYLPAAEQWAKTLAELKALALQGEDPDNIALRLREARTELLS